MSKVKNLPAITTLADEDVIYVVDDSAGTNGGRKITRANLASDLVGSVPPAAHAMVHEGGGIDEISAVTVSVNGLMSSSDKIKLDTVSANANPNVPEEDTQGYRFLIGSIVESPAVTVTESGGLVSLNLERAGGGDLTLITTTGLVSFDTTPAVSIALTAGTATVPMLNYVYILVSNGLLTDSTVSFPTAEHIPIATILLQDAAGVSVDGALKVHAWTDHVATVGDNGHLSHLNEWIRIQHATWKSGVDQTLNITTNGGSADNVIFTTQAGVVHQLHEHLFPAFGGTPTLFVVNDSTTPFRKITDINGLLVDANGDTLVDRYFSLVIFGVVNETSSESKLFICLPGGSYGNEASLIQDHDKFANFTLPPDFKGTAFLISELKLRHQSAASGTWTEVVSSDLRGLAPAINAGAGNIQSKTFSDDAFSIFNVSDNSKEIAFDASAISTTTKRTISMPDADITLGQIINASIEIATPFATTSVTDVIITSFVLTPPAGTYDITANIQAANTGNGNDASLSFYKNTTQVPISERTNDMDSASTPHQLSIMSEVSMNGTDTIEVRVRTTGGTLTITDRRMRMLRIG